MQDMSDWRIHIGTEERHVRLEVSGRKTLNDFSARMLQWEDEAIALSNQMNGIRREIQQHSKLLFELNDSLTKE